MTFRQSLANGARWVGNFLHEHRKAVTGGIVAGVSVWLTLKSDGMTRDEWFQVLGAVAVGSGLVGAIPNRNTIKKDDTKNGEQ